MQDQSQGSMKGCLIAVVSLCLAALLLCVCAGSALIVAPLAAFAGGAGSAGGSGGGGGGANCTVLPTPTAGGVATSCSVVAWAQTIANHLQMCGADPQLNIPNFDKCYAAPPDANAMPQAVLTYLAQNYPGDQANWVSGNFQCVSLVAAAYGLAGIPLPKSGDAVQFWPLYRALSGWLAIPTGNSPQPGTPGVPPSPPEPGDLMVWQHVIDAQGNQDAGHIAVVIGVTLPQNGQNGSITVAQANSFAPITTVGLTPDLRVLPWPGGTAYTALGYIRPKTPPLAPVADGAQAFICAALPWARLEQQYEVSGPVPGEPNPFPNLQPLPHPWYVSVLLAQWGIEQGWSIPGYTGYNWGNASAIPDFPTVPGTGTLGSPGAFAYAPNAQVGIEIHSIFTKMGLYATIWQSYQLGPMAQASALGQSPWDAAHYTADGHPGDSLTTVMTTYNLQRFDQPDATC